MSPVSGFGEAPPERTAEGALGAAIKKAQAAGDPDRGETYHPHVLNALEQLLADKGPKRNTVEMDPWAARHPVNTSRD